ncbi:DoxX family protein [Halostella sp. PRR32]|uniref:DoxX family protein n=1 Tax=Halostella sp. PRR32 TaxID=3098147 RepID=UPI002B1DE4BB|nr:DoxX family protein [Halostella sp. PRR32]
MILRRTAAWFVAVTGALVAVSGRARAHVRYVTEGSGDPVDAIRFVVDVLGDPVNAALFAGGGLALAATVAGYLRFRPAAYDLAVLRTTLQEYVDLVPWMLRLSVGLPLVGAGFAGYFFSPAVPAVTRLFQVGIGFFLLFGFATRFVAAIGLIGYLVRLPFDPLLLLASEYVGALLAIVLVGSGRPSADQMFKELADNDRTMYSEIDPVRGVSRRFDALVSPYEDYAATAVRIALGVNFIILGFVEKLLNPGRALQVVEKYDLTAVVPVEPGMWVVGAGLTEMALGFILILGLFTRASAAVAFVLFTTTLFGLPDDPVIAHISLFGLASLLFITGSGPLALDNWLHGRTATVDTSTTGTEEATDVEEAPAGDVGAGGPSESE